MSEAPYDFKRPMPAAIRILMLAAGLFCIVMPAYEFRQVFLHPSLLTLFFGALTLGAWTVGGNFVLGAIMGAEQNWKFSNGQLVVQNKNWLKSWAVNVDGQAISASRVHEVEWDSRANTYSVMLSLKDGTTLETHGLDTPDAAERFRQRILAYLADA